MNSFATSGVVLTLLIHGGVIAALAAFSNWGDGDESRPTLNMVTIEASLAYKSKEQSKQPQKQRQRKKPTTKPQGVSRDEDKKVEPKKETRKEEPEEDFAEDFKNYMNKYQTNEDEDLEAGDEEPKSGGQFNGSEHGFAEVSKGDPYMQELAAGIFASWTVPTLETGEGTAVGCVRLAQDGSIVDTKLYKETRNANIDRSVKLALKDLKELRKPGDAPVPRHLMDATKQWTCFNFPVGKQ